MIVDEVHGDADVCNTVNLVNCMNFKKPTFDLVSTLTSAVMLFLLKLVLISAANTSPFLTPVVTKF